MDATTTPGPSVEPRLPTAGKYAYWYDEKKTTQFMENQPITYPGGQRPLTLEVTKVDGGRHIEWSHNGGPSDEPGGSTLSVRRGDLVGVFPSTEIGGPGYADWSPPLVLVPSPLTAGSERKGTSQAAHKVGKNTVDSTIEWSVLITGRRTLRISGRETTAWTLHRTWTKRGTLRGCTPAPDKDCSGQSTSTSDEVYVPELGIVDTTGHEEFKSESSSGVIDYRLYIDGIDQ